MSQVFRIAVAASLGMAALAAAPADAAQQGGKRYVTAVSRYGNGTLTAPIRPARFGYEVQLPGGVWIDCAGDCRETLRRQKLDYWETQQEDRGDSDSEFPE